MESSTASIIAESSSDVAYPNDKESKRLNSAIHAPKYADRAWVCEVHFNHKIMKVCGEDSLQSLCLAIGVVKLELKTAKFVYFPDSEHVSILGAYFPD